MKEDWEFERSSGYAGYRNKITGEWVYEKEFAEKENKAEEKLYTKEQMREAFNAGLNCPIAGATFEEWLNNN